MIDSFCQEFQLRMLLFIWFCVFKQVMDFLGEAICTRARRYSLITIRDVFFVRSNYQCKLSTKLQIQLFLSIYWRNISLTAVPLEINPIGNITKHELGYYS
jgi:hypothetical protein